MIDQLVISQNLVDVFNYENHNTEKQKTVAQIRAFAEKHVNYNNTHHTTVFQSQHDIHNNNLFKNVLESEEIKEYGKLLSLRYTIKSFLSFAVTESWFTIIPPGGITMPISTNGIVTCCYFLESGPHTGHMTFDSGINEKYFDPIKDAHNSHSFNSNKLDTMTPEGCIFGWPSYVKHNYATNISREDKILYTFVLDLVTV